MSDRWFFEVLGESFGPVTVEELTRLAEAGELSQTDRVRSEQSENWQAAQELIDFSNISQVSPPSSTAVMSTTTQWDDGVTHTPKPSLDEFADLDELVIKQETTTDRESVSLDRFINQHSSAPSFKLPESPINHAADDEGSFELDAEIENQTGVIWFYKVAGIEIGPVGKVELQMKIDRKEISRNDYIREGTNGAWQRSERVQDFRFPPPPKPKPKPAPVENKPSTPVATNPTEQPVANKTEPTPSTTAVSPTNDSSLEEKPASATTAPAASEQVTQPAATNQTPPAPKAEQPQPSPAANAPSTPAAQPITPKANSVSSNNPYTKSSAPIPSTPRPKQARPKRKRGGGGVGFDFDLSVLTEGPAKFVGIGIVVLLLGYGIFSLDLFAKGGGALVASETLWAEIQEAEQNNASNFGEIAKSDFLPRAKSILDSIKGITNQESKVVARIRTGMKDGVVRYLELYPLAKEKTAKVATMQLEMARKSYEGE